ncbi:hypothetical protein KJ562_02830 [Patescibacteria group bacterium]|nr:hypothetical protein [Patescibacteria group bacterium]MBU4162187.1 hypothetical protein [Patescibacteria group bacterium]
MLSKIVKLVNKNKDVILLALIIFLASLFIFSLIWIFIELGSSKPIEIY